MRVPKIFARRRRGRRVRPPAACSTAAEPRPGQAGHGVVAPGPSHTAAMAVNGDPETRWCLRRPHGPLAPDRLAPAAARLLGCEICWEKDRRLYQYLVEGSTDGQTWTILSDQRATTRRDQVQKLTFTAAAARYVRVTVTGLQMPRPQWASIREIRIYGK